jgi:tetratricopeptide (TPR) repeat protein
MTESTAEGRPGGEHSRVLHSNADEFYVPTIEARQAERERNEAHVSLVAASFIILVADVLWALVSAVLLDDFRMASLAVLATDAAVVALTRQSGARASTAVVARGLIGILVFGIEFAFVGANSGYILGQVLFAGGAVVLSVGRGGEGRNMLGIALVFVGLIMAMVIGLVQEQGRIRALNDQFYQALQLALVGRAEDSLEIVDELLADNPDDPRVYLMAIEYFTSEIVGDLDTALVVALRAAELADGDMQIEALFSAAQILATRGEFERALQYADEVIAKVDDSPPVFMFRAQVLFQLGRTQDALTDLRRAEELAPDSDMGQMARLLRLNLEGPDFSTIIRADR